MITMSTGVASSSGLTLFFASAIDAGQALLIVLGFASMRGWLVAAAGAGAATILLTIAAIVDEGYLISLIAGELMRCLLGAPIAIVGLTVLVCAVLNRSEQYRFCNPFHPHAIDLGRIHTVMTKVALPVLIIIACLLLLGVDTIRRAMALQAARDQMGIVVVGAMAAVVNLLALAALAVLLVSPFDSRRSILLVIPRLAVGALLLSAGVFHGAIGLGMQWPTGQWTLVILTLAAIGMAFAALGCRATATRGKGQT